LSGLATSRSFFDVLGARPVLGRLFDPSEDRKGGDVRVALIGERLWVRRFGSDPRVLERTIDLDGVRHRVIGVMPAALDVFIETDVWTPLAADYSWPRADRRLGAVGRLAAGATLEQANRELVQISKELATAYPRSNGAWSGDVRSFDDAFISPRLRARV